MENHLENGILPEFPDELRCSTHIGIEEESNMGIGEPLTRAWRMKSAIPDSDAIEEIKQELEEQTLQRKGQDLTNQMHLMHPSGHLHQKECISRWVSNILQDS